MSDHTQKPSAQSEHRDCPSRPPQFYFCKGRTALYAILKALRISAGDRILVPGYTCVVVPYAVRYADAVPEYADIEPDSYNVSLEGYRQVVERLREAGTDGQLKAVILQHTYGNINRDSVRIAAWAHNRGLQVIEDCAHTEGAAVDGTLVGSFGDAAFFSTQWNKPYTTGLGGFAQGNRPELSTALAQVAAEADATSFPASLLLLALLVVHDRARRLNLYWVARRAYRALARRRLVMGSSSPAELRGERPALVLRRMARLQRWVLNRRRQRLADINQHRVALTNGYDVLLDQFGLPAFARTAGSVLLRYPVRVPNKERLLQEAEAAGIELGHWFDHCLHPQNANRLGLNWDDRHCPMAKLAADTVVNLPIHSGISNSRARRIVEFVRRRGLS